MRDRRTQGRWSSCRSAPRSRAVQRAGKSGGNLFAVRPQRNRLARMAAMEKQFSVTRRASKGSFVWFGFTALACSIGAVAQVLDPVSPVLPVTQVLILSGPGTWVLPDSYLILGSVNVS